MSNETLINSFTRGRLRLKQMALRLLANPDDAEDALQEAFCRLWPRADTLLTEQDADRMAMTTVKNISIDQLRTRRKTSELNDEALPNGDHSRTENASQLELVNEIINAHLTPLQQRIFRWHDIDGLSYEEIAKKEQLLEPALRKQLSRARKTIRECYQKIENNENR